MVPKRLRRRGLVIGVGVVFHDMPIVSMAHSSQIVVQDRAVLTSHAAFTALGISRPCVLRTLRAGASINIGEDTGMSGVVICAATSVSIGKQCLLGAGVMLMDNDFHPVLPENRRFNRNPRDIQALPIVVEDNVFIGAGTIVLKGVQIGTNSVIGAGSVVVSDIPRNVIAAGNPARVIRSVYP